MDEINKAFPISIRYDFEKGELFPCERTAVRRVSDLSIYFADQSAVEEAIENGDPIIYETFYYGFETGVSDMAVGVTRLQPGMIGKEYFMTKGHYHAQEDQSEIYFCIKGAGYLLLESKENDFQVERWEMGVISHTPPAWAHRVVNTGYEPLVYLASYHLSAGHDYAPIIDRKGFQKRVMEKEGEAVFVENEINNDSGELSLQNQENK